MNSENTTVDVGVIGVGSMGQHHARVYNELTNANLVGVFDTDSDRAAEIAAKHGTEALKLDELLKNAAAVSVVVPTEYHLTIAEQALAAGVAPLIEKPVVTDQSEGKKLRALRDEAGLPVQIGHIERFNPAVSALKNVLDEMTVLSLKAERLGPPPSREIHDSAVLDLMIHDIDIVLSLVDGEPIEVNSAGIRDNRHTTATITFDSGVIANLTASRLTQRKVRKLTITAEECLVEVDYMDQSIEIHRQSIPEYIENNGNVRFRHESIIERPTIRNGEPLKQELQAFVTAVETGSEPIVTVEDGLKALELAQTIEKMGNRTAIKPKK